VRTYGEVANRALGDDRVLVLAEDVLKRLRAADESPGRAASCGLDGVARPFAADAELVQLAGARFGAELSRSFRLISL
jgi:hypothetical protein